jgi:Tfp pilus assembly protein PilX
MHRMLRTLRRDEGGWALVSAVMLLAVMIALGLGLAATIDVQSKEGGTQRKRETVFNVAEAALNAQARAVGYQWPGKGTATTPFVTCTTGATSDRCPPSAQITKLIPSVDTAAGVTWQTEVHDNGTPTLEYYDDAQTRLQPGYDANGDDKVWVRAQATVAGKTRTMVALLRVQYQQEDILRAAVRTGRLRFTNAGRNKQFIDGQTGGVVQVRCTPGINQPVCLGVEYPHGYIKDQDDYEDALDQWIQPNNSEQIDLTPAMSLESLERMKATAKSLGTYYTTCPSSLAGRVVWIDHVSGCHVSGGGTMNSATSPGMVIVDGGSLRLTGSGTYYGVLFYTETGALANGTLSSLTTDPAIDLSGTVAIKGGVVTDGNTTINVGDSNSGAAITFDGRGFDAVSSITTADVVQNTWRELTK